MKIGVFGTGTVGRTFAEKLIGLGHEVTIGTRNVAEKLADTSKDYMGNPPFSDWHKSNNKSDWEPFLMPQPSGKF